MLTWLNSTTVEGMQYSFLYPVSDLMFTEIVVCSFLRGNH